jgi:hypothetical protein
MGYFYISGIILILVLMFFKVFTYWRFRRKLNANLIVLIRLEGYKNFSYAYLFTAFCMLMCLFFSSRGNKLEGNQIFVSLFWAVAFAFQLINAFIEPQNYFLMNEQGFKKLYMRKWNHWGIVDKLDVKEKKLFIVTGKKIYFLAFGDRSGINHFMVELKRFQPELYQKYLMNLSKA